MALGAPTGIPPAPNSHAPAPSQRLDPTVDRAQAMDFHAKMAASELLTQRQGPSIAQLLDQNMISPSQPSNSQNLGELVRPFTNQRGRTPRGITDATRAGASSVPAARPGGGGGAGPSGVHGETPTFPAPPRPPAASPSPPVAGRLEPASGSRPDSPSNHSSHSRDSRSTSRTGAASNSTTGPPPGSLQALRRRGTSRTTGGGRGSNPGSRTSSMPPSREGLTAARGPGAAAPRHGPGAAAAARAAARAAAAPRAPRASAPARGSVAPPGTTGVRRFGGGRTAVLPVVGPLRTSPSLSVNGQAPVLATPQAGRTEPPSAAQMAMQRAAAAAALRPRTGPVRSPTFTVGHRHTTRRCARTSQALCALRAARGRACARAALSATPHVN